MIPFMSFPMCSSRRMVSYTCCFVTVCLVLHVWIMTDIFRFVDNVSSVFFTRNKGQSIHASTKQYYKTRTTTEVKYVLMWKRYYLIKSNDGVDIFPTLHCPVSNCVFTDNRKLLGNDYSNFDALIFDYELTKKDDKPVKRSRSQIYIFTTIESSYTQPLCEVTNDNFFNWTFTPRLDSDVLWLYFVVTDTSGTVVAPRRNVKWKTSLEPVRPEIKTILRRKKKTAAWLVSHCTTDSFRDQYLSRLQEHLYHYSLRIDVYGMCSNNKCPNDNCDELIKNEYYFYMAFENSFAVDYVSEKVLHGYNNYAIPIVYGGANYSRFLPPGSYINAREIHPYNLAYIIQEVVKTPALQETFFRWTNLYKITDDPKVYHPLCDLCKALHSTKALFAPAKKNIRVWWNGRNGMKWCLSDSYWNESSKVNIDAKHIFPLY
ncbi:alpha-(1,3)-fucosyltransferase C-like [Ostrinia furnacalis]|uniref:alpha-(1,3)-fucosyltransferase C-like n=1 Tax=Ostrinia furnacalis TaxID=93504 RepID=UPI001038B9AA|nr:alpha-(1,3)-fucosyltransferase C-like [Ostrinia furnacalis]